MIKLPTFKQFITRQVLIWAIIFNLAPILIYAADYFIEHIVYKYLDKVTYISEIKGTPEQVKLVKNSLDFFNNLCNSNNIKYSKPSGLFTRELTITVKEFNTVEEFDLAGYTYPYYRKPEIYIRPFPGEQDTFTQVLIHETLHAYGTLWHSEDPSDVMYESVSFVKEDNIKKHCEELKKFIND